MTSTKTRLSTPQEKAGWDKILAANLFLSLLKNHFFQNEQLGSESATEKKQQPSIYNSPLKHL